MRKKKTALQNPGDRKASPNQTKGLVAKGEKPAAISAGGVRP